MKKNRLTAITHIAIVTTVLSGMLALCGCSSSTSDDEPSNDTNSASTSTESTSSISADSSPSESGTVNEVHLSDDLKFLIESTDEEILKRCEDPQAELHTNNFIASDGRSYKITFGFEVIGAATGLYAPIEMLLPEKSFYSFGELCTLLDGNIKIDYEEPFKMAPESGGLAVSAEIDGKTVYLLAENTESGGYRLPFSTEVNFKGIAIDGTKVTDNREYM